MKKIKQLFLALALAVTFLSPCAVCEELKAHGTPEELAEHIQEVHEGIDPQDIIDIPGED